MVNPSSPDTCRLAEPVAALSLATDLGMGQPMEHALRTCLLGVGLGRQIGLDDEALGQVYYVSLLRHVGCTADSPETTALFGDDIAFRAGVATVFMGDLSELQEHLASYLRGGTGEPLRGAPRPSAQMVTAAAARASGAHCEVAQLLATRLGLGESVREALGHAFERWEGSGYPAGLPGESLPLAARAAVIARDIDLLSRAGGFELAAEVVRRRAGRAYDPHQGRTFLQHGRELLAEVEADPPWESVLMAEPGRRREVPEPEIDQVLRVFADFADLKSTYTRGHSTGVADLVEQAARLAGLGEPASTALRRAALLHDLGRVGIPNSIWENPGPLTSGEWERVRLHSYLTERVLRRSAFLAPLAQVAGAHHERLDGSGYHAGRVGSELSEGCRLLEAADAYQAMTQGRPHRPRLDKHAAAQALEREAVGGKLDRQAVAAVLAAAGQRSSRVACQRPAGLTEREVEVLRLLCGGLSNREVAERLSISPKTVGHHVQHIYDKIGVSTRAAAAIFAMEHHLLPTG